jgi:hypothetical protein
MWRAPDVPCKGALTIVSADNDSFEGDDCLLNPIDDRFTMLSSMSPRHKFMTTSPTNALTSPRRFFKEGEHLFQKERLQDRDDLQLLQEYRYATCGGGVREDEYENLVHSSDSSEEDESDHIGLLAPTPRDSMSTSRRTLFAYSFDKYEEESIFEPSFEVALLHPDQLTVSIPEPETPDGEAVYIPPNPRSHPFPKPIPIPLRKPKPQRRYDKNGRPFLHIFHTGLTTLYEEDSTCSSVSVSGGTDSQTDGRGKSISARHDPQGPTTPQESSLFQEAMLTQEFVAEDIVIRARWEYAVDKMTHLDAHSFTGRRPYQRRPYSRHRGSSSSRVNILHEI